jgi:hypothetical protein
MYDHCEVCDRRIVRDVLMSISNVPSYWLGVCGCPARKWRWRSATGDMPWELIGGATRADPLPDA